MSSPDIAIAKQRVREEVWGSLEASGVAPGCRGGIPNFRGAREAAQHLAKLSLWRTAEVIMVAPDRSAAPVRWQALREGRLLYMAVPRIERERPFVFLDPAILSDLVEEDASIERCLELGVPVRLAEMQPVDLAVGGSVAVNWRGARVGKGRGYFDTELAMLVETGRMERHTPVATTIHSSQVVPGELPESEHDGRVTAYATELGAYVMAMADRRPLPGLVRDHLGSHADAIPALEDFLRGDQTGR